MTDTLHNDPHTFLIMPWV